MEPRELSTDAFGSLAQDRQPWWVARAEPWHAVELPGRTRCGLAVEEPPYHHQQVVAEAPDAVHVCGRCLAELEADEEPDGLGELLLQQFRLSYGE